MTKYNIYCDESCHLENDKQRSMVFGALMCPQDKRKTYFEEIRSIKIKHGLSKEFEAKWHKVSPAKLDFYLDLINYYFNNPDLHFRALVVPDKSKLDHYGFNQTHDEFYYKMFFDLLKILFSPEQSYYIYLDIKDTKSQDKVELLRDILRRNQLDYDRSIIKMIQQIHSHEVELMQITDLLIGALSYLHRELSTSQAKLRIIKLIQERSGYNLKRSTLFLENKMNIFVWKPKEVLKNELQNK